MYNEQELLCDEEQLPASLSEQILTCPEGVQIEQVWTWQGVGPGWVDPQVNKFE